jgi:hypothetical protein
VAVILSEVIFAASGTKMMHCNFNSQNTSLAIDGRKLAQGFYFVNVTTGFKTITLPFGERIK